VDNTKFLEQFRYLIVASQLLSGHQYHGQGSYSNSQRRKLDDNSAIQLKSVSPVGAVATASVAFGVSWIIRWSASAQDLKGIILRFTIVFGLLVAAAILGQANLRRRWLHNLRQQNIAETTKCLGHSQDLDSAITAALSLIQEVELVSRGYRMCVFQEAVLTHANG
jgi:hypothetical protein